MSNAILVNAVKMVTIIFLCTLASVILWPGKKVDAENALNRAISRMEAVAKQNDPALLAIACNNTHDPIACVGDKDGIITITYFSGDNSHRVPYATVRIWVEKRPQLLFTSTEFNTGGEK